MAKVRRIDWSPDEYMAGTFGNLTVDEHGAYIIALNLIYSSGGPIYIDLGRFAHAACSRPQRMRALLDRLVAKGKLRFTDDGRLANGRAELELDRAAGRIDGARKAGFISGSTRFQKAVLKKMPAVNSHLAERPFVSSTTIYDHDLNHRKSTDAAREPSPELAAAQARAPTRPANSKERMAWLVEAHRQQTLRKGKA